VKDENGDLHAVSHNILNRLKNYFFQLLNVHNVRQIEIHTAEILVPGLSRHEVEIAIAKLKKYKSPGSDQIPAELIQAGGEILLSAIHKHINSVWNKEELPDQWKESIIVPIHKKGYKTDWNKEYQFTKKVIKLTVIIIVGYQCYQPHKKCYRNTFSHG
jgi:hypothetical protein